MILLVEKIFLQFVAIRFHRKALAVCIPCSLFLCNNLMLDQGSPHGEQARTQGSR
jgi:hypothetical protein